MAEKKAEYAPPGSQVDLKRRLENENKSDRVLSTADNYEPEELGEARTYAVEDNDLTQYVGTSPEYATYANETEAPLEADDSPEQQVFEQFAASPVAAPLKVDGNIEFVGEQDSKEGGEAEKPKATAKKAAPPKSES